MDPGHRRVLEELKGGGGGQVRVVKWMSVALRN